MKACLFRAQHRSSREADLIIGGFALQKVSSLTDEELSLFSHLLTWDDQDIFLWIQKDSECTVQKALKAFQQTHGTLL